MRNKTLTTCFVLALSASLLFIAPANAQTYNAYSGGYSTGYGTVYGSFGLAMATQNMYNTMQMQMQKTMARNAMIKKWGLAAVEKAEREAGTRSSSSSKAAAPSNAKIVVPPPVVPRNYGKYRPDATVDSAKALSDALGETPEEKALIKQIYTTTKAAFDKEAAAKGWQNNLAAGLTFFTVTAMTVYHDIPEPSDEAVLTYYKVMNAALDDIPEFAKVANRDKQGYNNMLIGFSGMLLAMYMEGKQTNDAGTLENTKKLSAMLTEMVLKTDAEKLQLENGLIVMK